MPEIHFKNKLVRTKGVLWIIIPAALLSVPGALLTGMAGPKALKICFGVFFLAIGGAEIFGSAKKMKDKNIPIFICNPSSHAEKIFKMTGLYEIMPKIV